MAARIFYWDILERHCEVRSNLPIDNCACKAFRHNPEIASYQ